MLLRTYSRDHNESRFMIYLKFEHYDVCIEIIQAVTTNFLVPLGQAKAAEMGMSDKRFIIGKYGLSFL